jgi:hypothetical protein
VPAAAVTPAPIAYIKVVAVKKLVVGCLSSAGRRRSESRVRVFALGDGCQSPTLFTVGQHRRSGGRWVVRNRAVLAAALKTVGGSESCSIRSTRQSFGVPFTGCLGRPATFTLNKLECSKQVYPNA